MYRIISQAEVLRKCRGKVYVDETEVGKRNVRKEGKRKGNMEKEGSREESERGKDIEDVKREGVC